jgi:hypothetical protein
LRDKGASGRADSGKDESPSARVNHRRFCRALFFTGAAVFRDRAVLDAGFFGRVFAGLTYVIAGGGPTAPGTE